MVGSYREKLNKLFRPEEARRSYGIDWDQIDSAARSSFPVLGGSGPVRDATGDKPLPDFVPDNGSAVTPDSGSAAGQEG